MTLRVRFAPSPTGNVHIGNIRAAIFNWLFARHENGTFLLRIEDTDRERSTPEAIRNLLDVMTWLGLDCDETPLYQTSQAHAHCQAADLLVADGHAYRYAKGDSSTEAILFRIPVHADALPGVSTAGPVEIQTHPEVPLSCDISGISFAQVSRKGAPVPQAACYAGMRDLTAFAADGTCIFNLEDVLEQLLTGEKTCEIHGVAKLCFTRRQITYRDLIKGELAKPLDSLRDFVIVRGDGTPVFHLANVCDDITQGITHIIRGDDHVENTYRHIFIFHALGHQPPSYAHLPMIVNAQGKPYSKRDGDAYVGEFKENGFLPQALFNYLTLLGWSPGDDREKLTREELVSLFSLDRVQSSPAQRDMRKLENLNGRYIAEMPVTEFVAMARDIAQPYTWSKTADPEYFAAVATLMQSRTKRLTDIAGWEFFFVDLPSYDDTSARKLLNKQPEGKALQNLQQSLQEIAFNPTAIEDAIHKVTDALGIPQGKLNQPLRVAVTGTTVGAGVYETLALLGRDRVLQRLRTAHEMFCHE
jgi:glutamyl-tRNA synthetase